MTEARQALGALGERVAERWLRARGWTILERRFRAGHRDIDLVAFHDGTVAFVEVKTRQSLDQGDPVEAVNWRKRKELARSAVVWIDRRSDLFGCRGAAFRFDVVGVLVEGSRVRVRHLPSAFWLPT